MAARPEVQAGDFVRTRPLLTRARCKVYDAEPPNGLYLETLRPGTLFGPVLSKVSSDRFETVQITAGWVNIWTSRQGGQQFAVVASSVSEHGVPASE